MSTVLVVEDDLPLARTWTRVLVEYDVVLAHDRRRARALLEDAAGPPIDAVLLDLKLPDGDGEKLIPDLHRRHPRGSQSLNWVLRKARNGRTDVNR